MPRHPRIAPTASSLSDNVFSALVAKARGRAGPIYPLHVGDTWLDPPEVARAEAQRSTDHARLHNYAPVQGEPAFLDAIEEHLVRKAQGRAVPDRESIQVMSGATAGLSVVCETLLDPGDEVLLPSPFWPLIRGMIAARGARPVEIPFFTRLDEPGFDAEAILEAQVTPRTVALYVNTPHNPTSRVLPPAVVDAMVRVARRHDLWVLCDEAYEELFFAEVAPPVWAHPELRERAIATHTLSKGFGLAGARVGFTHGPPEVMRAIRGMQTFQTYCAPRPMQLGAARALREGGPWLAEARAHYAEAGRRAAAALGVPAPEGGTFLFFDASRFLREGETLMGFLERCLDAGVLLTPGTASGRDYVTWARLCFTSVPPTDLDRALERLRAVLGG